MIKQIQLRGISHKPSDRSTVDGGLEECIDLRLEEQEHAPATEPENVTDDLAPGLSASGIDVLYIHKANAYTNYIGVKVVAVDSTPVKYLYAYHKPSSTWASQQIVQLPGNEYPKDISSVGNIVVVSIEGGALYLLYRDGEYKYLGDQIPRPTVYFFTDTTAAVTESKTFAAVDEMTIYNNETGSTGTPTAEDFWNFVVGRRLSLDEDGQTIADFYNEVYNSFWDYISARRKTNLGNGIFSAPVLVRYAVRLYDGSYIHLSEPILLSTTDNSHVAIYANNGTTPGEFDCSYSIIDTFKTQIKITYNPGNWAELIESVDVFMSTDILYPNMNTELMGAYPLTTGIMIKTVGFDDPIASFETEMLKASNFYRVLSYDLNALPNYDYMKPYSQDDLVVLPRLEESDAHTISPIGDLGTYNNRVISGNQIVTLSPGHDEPQCLQNIAGSDGRYYVIYYHVRDVDGNEHLVRGYSCQNINRLDVKAYVAYPDARCYQADLYIGTTLGTYTSMVTLPMKEHPRLNVAYGFWGVGKPLDTPDGDGRGGPAVVTGLPDDSSLNPTYEISNRLVMSDMDNPFVYSFGQRIQFTARILSALPVTTALSTSQFGQFPLYVFTEDGIWTVSLNDEGEMVASHPVSRDVAIEGTPTQLDQAIVFVSDQGVMLLSGSQISCISPYMDGPQFSLDGLMTIGCTLDKTLREEGFGDLLDIAVDTSDFKDFVRGSRPLYDYENKRILFFNPEEKYAYDFGIDTGTWHKVSVPFTMVGTDLSSFVRTLNSYPQAMAVIDGDIWNWSVHPDYNSDEFTYRKGFAITRSFDLGEPFVRKSIRSIRIRGTFNKGDVKYMLLGSMTGTKWQKLMSLRGGSYKFFRIVLLSDLEPGERISWIDVDYETRFADKLR